MLSIIKTRPLLNKIIVSVIIAAVIAVCLELLFIANDHYSVETLGNITSVAGPQDLVINTAESGEDVLVGAQHDIKALQVNFAEPLSVPVTVEYRSGDGRELYSQYEVSSGSMHAVCDIYESGVRSVLIHLSEACDISGIDMSDQHTELVSNSQTFNPARFLISMLCWAAVVFCFIHFCIWKRMRMTGASLCDCFVSSRKVFVRRLVTVLLCAAVPLIVTLGIMPACGIPVSGAVSAAVCVACVSAGIMTVFLKKTGRRPEWFFVLVLIPVSVAFAVLAPAAYSLVGWDEETHYNRIISTVYVNQDASYTYADDNYISRYYYEMISAADPEGKNPYSIDWSQEPYVQQQLNADYDAGTKYTVSNNTFSMERICYIPNAAGIYIARAFNLDFHAQLIMSRLMMVFFYGIFMWIAIRYLKSGKMIAAVLALLPTCIFLCCTFSYDPWIMALSIPAFALFFRQIQTPDSRIRYIDVAVIFGLLFLAFTPKEIYAPIILLTLFMPGSKFPSSKHRSVYIAVCAGVTAILLLDFALKILPVSAQAETVVSGLTDSKGEGANASAQFAYVMNDIGSFAGVMAAHLKSYLSPAGAQQYMVNFAYLGTGFLYEILLGCLLFVTFADRNRYDVLTSKWKTRITYLAVFLALTVIISAGFYLTFTAVGAEHIAGCQYRYLLPLMFPVLYAAGFPVKNNRLLKGNAGCIFYYIVLMICLVVLNANFFDCLFSRCV